MKVLKKFQCELCNTVYEIEDAAIKCETAHIEYNKIQVVKADHCRISPALPEEGQWPVSIIVGKQDTVGVFVRYKLDSIVDSAEMNPEYIW